MNMNLLYIIGIEFNQLQEILEIKTGSIFAKSYLFFLYNLVYLLLG